MQAAITPPITGYLPNKGKFNIGLSPEHKNVKTGMEINIKQRAISAARITCAR